MEKNILEATRIVEDQGDAAIQNLDKKEDGDCAWKKLMKQKEELIIFVIICVIFQFFYYRMVNFEKQLLEATRIVEDQIDAAIQKLDKLEDDDLAALQRQRAAALEKKMKQKEEWIANGHGKYSTFTSDEEFFQASRKSNLIVLHCYRTSKKRCKIVDMHLLTLARKHIETKFCRLDVAKSPFLNDFLKIRIFPTIYLFKDDVIVGKIVGFDEFGGVDFSTEMMEWRLGKYGVINYEGDLFSLPDTAASGSKKGS